MTISFDCLAFLQPFTGEEVVLVRLKVFIGEGEVFKFLQVDLEVFLALNPIQVVLGQLKGVL